MLSAFIQVLFSGICMFLLYKFLIHILGMQRIGLYSVVLSITSTLGIFNAGFSGSLVRYVSIFSTENQPKKVVSLIGTIFTSLLIFFSFLVCLLILGGSDLLLFLKLGTKEAIEFEMLLPLASMVFLTNILGGVFLSALEGFQRAYLKNYLLAGASLMNLLLAGLLVPNFELKGLFYANLISNFLVYLLAWNFVRVNLKAKIYLIPIYWNKALFKQTFGYNGTFQVISISSLFNDPLLRMLIVRFGGLPLAGIYELASKLILQVRGILVALNQNLIPVFASMEKEEDQENRLALFLKSHHLIFSISNFFLATLAAALPLFSVIWLDSVNKQFLQVALILIPGWIINTISVPVYFANIGFGKLKPVLIHHLALAILVPAFCYLSGILGFQLGVVASWSAGLILCSIPLIVDFFYRQRIPFPLIFPKGFHWMVFAHFGFILIWFFFWKAAGSFSFIQACIFAFSGVILYTFAYWKAGLLEELRKAIKR